MSIAYLDALRGELAGAGIGGRRQERILIEIADHLACDPTARLGSPRDIARRFADELGTLNTLRAAGRSFAGLAIAGLLFGAAFAGAPPGAFGAAPAGTPLAVRLARGVAVLAPQIAFAAGLLAAVRALHALRRDGRSVFSASEARIIGRRATVATVAGLATTISLGVIALALARGRPLRLADACPRCLRHGNGGAARGSSLAVGRRTAPPGGARRRRRPV